MAPSLPIGSPGVGMRREKDKPAKPIVLGETKHHALAVLPGAAREIARHSDANLPTSGIWVTSRVGDGVSCPVTGRTNTNRHPRLLSEEGKPYAQLRKRFESSRCRVEIQEPVQMASPTGSWLGTSTVNDRQPFSA